MKLSADKLCAAPELAALTLLDAALDVAILALLAAWPELQTGDFPDEEPRAALAIIEHASALADALRGYRRALATHPRRELDLPF